jgi:RNA polymerase sigma factor (sigma-70 family)
MDPIPTRQTLLSRLRCWEDQESWRSFFETYWKLIFNAAVRAGLSDAEAHDVVQETVLSVAKKMPGFRYDPSKGSFKGWLRQITRRRIADEIDQRLHRGSLNDGSEQLESPRPSEEEGVEAFEAVWEDEWKENLIAAAMDRVKKQVKPKHFQIFDLYVVKGWPLAEVTKSLKVSAALVYVTKHRISGLLRKESDRLQTEGAGA